MSKKIISALVLLTFLTGITIYGYDHQPQTSPVFVQADMTVSTAEAEEMVSSAGADTAASVLSPDTTDEADSAATEETETDTADSAAAVVTASAKTDPAAEDAEVPTSEDPADTLSVDMAKVTMFPEPKIMYVQSPVNVRKGPDTSFDRIGFVSLNEELSILGQYENDGWYHFIYHDEDAFVSNLFVSETMVEIPAVPDAASVADTSQQPEPLSPHPEAPPQEPAEAAGVLFIGDSRCVQMKDAVNGGGCTWICENAKGYDWLTETALKRADNVIGKGTKIVMCLGVNDTRNCSNYAAVMNQKAADWAARGAQTYYVSVNPVWENPYTSEEQVENFNASIIGQLNGIKWIDTHSWLVNNGYRLVDGLHYDANTYINIFNVIVGSL